MQKFEYKRIDVNINGEAQDALHALGHMGWESYAVMPVPGTAVVVHFLKRPIIDEPSMPQQRPMPKLKAR